MDADIAGPRGHLGQGLGLTAGSQQRALSFGPGGLDGCGPQRDGHAVLTRALETRPRKDDTSHTPKAGR